MIKDSKNKVRTFHIQSTEFKSQMDLNQSSVLFSIVNHVMKKREKYESGNLENKISLFERLNVHR